MRSTRPPCSQPIPADPRRPGLLQSLGPGPPPGLTLSMPVSILPSLDLLRTDPGICRSPCPADGSALGDPSRGRFGSGRVAGRAWLKPCPYPPVSIRFCVASRPPPSIAPRRHFRPPSTCIIFCGLLRMRKTAQERSPPGAGGHHCEGKQHEVTARGNDEWLTRPPRRCSGGKSHDEPTSGFGCR